MKMTSVDSRPKSRQKVSMLEPISEPSEWMEVSLVQQGEDEFAGLWADFDKEQLKSDTPQSTAESTSGYAHVVKAARARQSVDAKPPVSAYGQAALTAQALSERRSKAQDPAGDVVRVHANLRSRAPVRKDSSGSSAAAESARNFAVAKKSPTAVRRGARGGAEDASLLVEAAMPKNSWAPRAKSEDSARGAPTINTALLARKEGRASSSAARTRRTPSAKSSNAPSAASSPTGSTRIGTRTTSFAIENPRAIHISVDLRDDSEKHSLEHSPAELLEQQNSSSSHGSVSGYAQIETKRVKPPGKSSSVPTPVINRWVPSTRGYAEQHIARSKHKMHKVPREEAMDFVRSDSASSTSVSQNTTFSIPAITSVVSKHELGYTVLGVVIAAHHYDPSKSFWPLPEHSHPRLPLSKGQIIEIIADDDHGWMFGVSGGRRGYFPTSYTMPLNSTAVSMRSVSLDSDTRTDVSSVRDAGRSMSDAEQVKDSEISGEQDGKIEVATDLVESLKDEYSWKLKSLKDECKNEDQNSAQEKEELCAIEIPTVSPLNSIAASRQVSDAPTELSMLSTLEKNSLVVQPQSSLSTDSKSSDSASHFASPIDLSSRTVVSFQSPTSGVRSVSNDNANDNRVPVDCTQLSSSDEETARNDFVDAVEMCDGSWRSAMSDRSESLRSPSKAETTADTSTVETVVVAAEESLEDEVSIEIEIEKLQVKKTTFRIMDKVDTFEEAMRMRTQKPNDETENSDTSAPVTSHASLVNLQKAYAKNSPTHKPGAKLMASCEQLEAVGTQDHETIVGTQDHETIVEPQGYEEDENLKDTWAQIEKQTEELRLQEATRPVGKIDPNPARIMNYTEAKLYLCGLELDNQILDDLGNQLAISRGSCSCLVRPRNLRDIPRLTKVQQSEGDRIQCLIRNKYDHQNTDHARMIMGIFQKLTGNSHAPLIYGSHWEDIGFQGSDPATDLNRFGGVFHLLVMLHFIQKAPKLLQKIFSQSHHEFQHFPLMSTSINFTKLTVDLFREGKLSSLKGDLIDALSEVHNAMLALFAEKTRLHVRTIHNFSQTLKEVEVAAQTPHKLLKSFYDMQSAVDNPVSDVTVNLSDWDEKKQRTATSSTINEAELRYAVEGSSPMDKEAV